MLKELLINLARSAISDALNHTSTIEEKKLFERYPDFEKSVATFVTLTIEGKLRGCIGSLVPKRSLFEDLTDNARSAALSDPRFPRLNLEELPKVKIEVSLLSEPKELLYTTIKEL